MTTVDPAALEYERVMDATVVALACAVLEPLPRDLPGPEELVPVMGYSGPNTFTDLVSQFFIKEFRPKKNQSLYAPLERHPRFESVVHPFQRSVPEELLRRVKHLDPTMWEGPQGPVKNPTFCSLTFRERRKESLLVDIQNIQLEHSSLVSPYTDSQDVNQIADEIHRYITRGRRVWMGVSFKVPRKIIENRRKSLALNRQRPRLNPLAIPPMHMNQKALTEPGYGVLMPDARFRIASRVFSYETLQDFEFGNNGDEVLESCVFLFEHMMDNKKTANRENLPFYRGAPCEFSSTHHICLTKYPIRDTATGRCIACLKLWPYLVHESLGSEARSGRSNQEQYSSSLEDFRHSRRCARLPATALEEPLSDIEEHEAPWEGEIIKFTLMPEDRIKQSISPKIENGEAGESSISDNTVPVAVADMNLFEIVPATVHSAEERNIRVAVHADGHLSFPDDDGETQMQDD